MTISNDSSHLTMKGNTKVIIKASQTIVGSGTRLPIEIVGEFKDIPPHLHQIYMNYMLASYGGNLNVYDNTNEEPKEIEEPKTIEEQKSEWRLNKIVKIISDAINKQYGKV